MRNGFIVLAESPEEFDRKIQVHDLTVTGGV